MKLIDTVCPNCGATLNIHPLRRSASCEYCDSKFIIDDDDTPRTVAESTAEPRSAAEKTFEENAEAVIDIASEVVSHRAKRKKNLVWWILGWIFIFPVPATILAVRSRMSTVAKIAVIAAVWLAYLAIGYSTPEEPADVNVTTSSEITVLDDYEKP